MAYWIKAGFAVLAGIFSYSIQNYLNLDGSIVFMLGALVFLAFSDLLSAILKLERNHALKIGIGAYLFTWIITWTILYTVFNPTV